jgi:glycosyltransferase involved in cell wall biosynthesis
MKIGVLTKRYYTGKDLLKDRYGRLYHLPKAWAELGAEVDVIALDYRRGIPEEVTEGRLRLRSIPSSGFRLGQLEHEIRWDHYDVLVASGHLNLGRMVRSIAHKNQIPCLFDLYDYYPAFLGAFHRIGAIYMSHLLRAFNGIMVVSSALEAFCRSPNGAICRIPNGVDRHLFQQIPQAQAREELSIEANIPIFGLFGSISDDLGRLEVLEAFRDFRKQSPNAQLLVGGTGSSFFEGIEGARSLGMLHQSDLPRWASACDCLLIPYRQSLQVRYSQSARLAEYLALGKPIVVTRTGDAESWFPANYSGWCEPADSRSMLRAMISQIENAEILPFPEHLAWGALGKTSSDFIHRRLD